MKSLHRSCGGVGGRREGSSISSEQQAHESSAGSDGSVLWTEFSLLQPKMQDFLRLNHRVMDMASWTWKMGSLKSVTISERSQLVVFYLSWGGREIVAKFSRSRQRNVEGPDPEAGGESAGQRHTEVASVGIVRDTLMITKLGSGVEAGDRQTAAGTGGQESRSGTEG